MTNVNYEWVNQQFTAAKVRVGTGKAILKLLKTWEEIDVTPEQAKDIFEILSKVAQGHALVQTPKDEVWVQAQAGQLKVGDPILRSTITSKTDPFIHATIFSSAYGCD